jgi:hypothetical protein
MNNTLPMISARIQSGVPLLTTSENFMQAVEFQATIKNGTIEIPTEFRDRLAGNVRVILLTEDRPRTGANLIDRLLAQPMQVPGFRPLAREEVHVR